MLPPTYTEFTEKWYEMFPHVYDTKVLSINSEIFPRTELGKLYEKIKTDPRMQYNQKMLFDLQ